MKNNVNNFSVSSKLINKNMFGLNKYIRPVFLI